MTSILRKLYFDIFFCIFLLFFIFKYDTSEEKRIISVIFIFSNLVFYVIYLNTNKLIYNNVWLLNTIFTNKLQFCLVLLAYKLLAFRTFCFQLIVQFLPFRLLSFLTNYSFNTFEASTRCWVEILRLGAGWYLVDSKTMPYFIDYSYLQSIWLAISSSYCWQNQILS